MNGCYIFPPRVLAVILLIEVLIGIMVTRTCTNVKQGLLFTLRLSPPYLVSDLLPTCWNRSPRSISELLCVIGRTEGCLEASAGRGSAKLSSAGAVHQEVSSVVSPFTHCVGSQNTLLQVLPLALPQQFEFCYLLWCPLGAVLRKPPTQVH